MADLIRPCTDRDLEMVPREEVPLLLRRYWSVPERQIETSVVLAEKTWRDRG